MEQLSDRPPLSSLNLDSASAHQERIGKISSYWLAFPDFSSSAPSAPLHSSLFSRKDEANTCTDEWQGAFVSRG